MIVLKFLLGFVIAVVSFLCAWLLEGTISLPLVKLLGFETITYTIILFVLLILGLVFTTLYYIYQKKTNKEWKGTHLIYVMVALFGAILGNFPNLAEGKSPYYHISYYKKFDERAIIKYRHFKSGSEDYSYNKGLVTVSGDVLIPGRIIGDPDIEYYYFGSFIDNESGNQLYFTEYKNLCNDNMTTISIFENGKPKYQYEFYEEKDSDLSGSEKKNIVKKIINENLGTLLQIEEGGVAMGNIINWDAHYFE